ncbi:hypothetical protein A2673_03565 [Candidatus Kaiserbacteria bacterium RIFCSPHIGHO2_01_FULL_50_13]|nr:MAG: hypothetical protein A2673_03565 [Candidatus Kaiserbacteria bacterium RIFCSPHIGHO2_01_FULL_50_13]
MGGFIKPLKKSVIMHFIRTLEELLEASPDAYHAAKERIGRCKNRTIPDVLRELREIRSLNGSLKSLYALKKKGKEFDLACLLHFFPPETIYGEFSEDTFLWLLAEKEKYFFTYEWSDDDVQKLTGKNKRTMVRASTTAAEFATTSPPTLYTRETIFTIANCLDALSPILSSLDTEAFIQSNLKEGRAFSQERCGEYSLLSFHARENCRGYVDRWRDRIAEGTRQKISVYLDVPMAIALFWNHAPAAVAGILPLSAKTLAIYQLQGVKPILVDEQGKEIGKGASWGLEPLDWKKLLVECVLQVAPRLGFSKVGIQSGYDNAWRKSGSLPLERAVAIYDATAERFGFKQRNFFLRKDQTWYKNITVYD